jgi:hypothetical protein
MHGEKDSLERALRGHRRGRDDGSAARGVVDLAARDGRGTTRQAMSALDTVKGKLADELAEDAAFLRKLRPSLIAKRAKGQAPTEETPGEAPRAPSGPQLGPRREKRSGGGPSPFLIVGAALVAGVALAKWIDWRGHAHPRL